MAVKSNITVDLNNFKIVPIGEVRPNSWNPKKKDTPEFAKVKKSLETIGQDVAIIVRENEGYEILDGEQRWTAANELGWDNILIYNAGKVTDQVAMESTIWHEMQVPFDNIDLAFMVTDMAEKFKELHLPYSEAEMMEFKNLAKFQMDYEPSEPEADQDGMKTIRITTTDAQYKIIMEALGRVQQTNDWSEGQALEAICADYLAGSIASEIDDIKSGD